MADLSEDSLPPEERVVANLGLEESAHRIGAQADSVRADAQVGCFGPTPYRPKQPN